MITSSVPAVKKAIKARLEADADILADAAEHGGDLAVIIGNPQPETAPRTIIVISNMENHHYDYTCGMSQANETYDITVIVSLVDYTANDKEQLITRTYHLADIVNASFVAWNFEDNRPMNAIVSEQTSDQEFTADDAREFAVTMTAHIVNRVS